MVDNSFNLLDLANTKISAHLKSLAKLSGTAEGGLNIYDLKGLREKIDSGLASAAARTAGIVEKTETPANPPETGSTEKKQDNN
jgi:hypothetical protein